MLSCGENPEVLQAEESPTVEKHICKTFKYFQQLENLLKVV